MVLNREQHYIAANGHLDIEAWLLHIGERMSADKLIVIRHACQLSQLTGEKQETLTGTSCLQEGLAMADILQQLHMDEISLAAAIIYDCVQYADLDLDDVSEHLGPDVAKLVAGVLQMSSLRNLQQILSGDNDDQQQVDNIRKMLVAMVSDVRVVLIKLAEQVCILRGAKLLNDQACYRIAQENMKIYAPLANRLGVSQIKWEIEDLAFRYIEPEIYHSLAKKLRSRRTEREQYVNEAIEVLQRNIRKAGIKDVQIDGRAKHIYSIHRKMQRKNVGIDEIYDALAVRVLVNSVDDCYAVLGLVHAAWPQIPSEFDDYISSPKENGYRSLHTAVIGPHERSLEVQIRTHAMHEESELGMAAHWHYKQGGKRSSHEGRISLLRQLLEWQQDLTPASNKTQHLNEASKLADRVYVFTPKGEIKDLPPGSTPLDFAYQVHSEVGHRCRGAKVNGHIVPLSYQLKTGEQVDILTGKEARPSRDWMNANLGFLCSAKARAKVHHWFKQQDYDKNLSDGQQLLKSELQRLHLDKHPLEPLVTKFNLKSLDDVFAAIGCGDIRVTQIISYLQQQQQQTERPLIPAKATGPATQQDHKPGSHDIYIDGVGNLLTTIAQCCKPLPGDDIVGYITMGRGVSIHRADCSNMLHMNTENAHKVIEVNWGDKLRRYTVILNIHAYDRRNLVRDITTVIANQQVNVTGLTTNTDQQEHIATINLNIEIGDLNHLSQLVNAINQLPNIISVRRQQE